jgi:tetratricopeptide (TPR) repeat protein
LQNLQPLNRSIKRDIHNEIGGQPRSLELLDGILTQENLHWENIKQKLAQVKKDAFADLLLDILWEKLTTEEQNLLQWISLFRSPIPQHELKKLQQFTLKNEQLFKLQRMSLLYSVYLPKKLTLHYVHRLTADFINTPERIPTAELQKRHKVVADYYKEYSQQSKSLDDLLKARYHYIEAKNIKQANSAAFEAEFYYRRWGFLDAAPKLNEEALELAQDEKDKSTAKHNMGMIYQSRGDYDRALELYGKSLKIAEKLGDINGIALTQGQIGKLLMDQCKYEEAVPKILLAYQIFEKLASPNINIVGDWLPQIREKIGEKKLQQIIERLGRTSGEY